MSNTVFLSAPGIQYSVTDIAVTPYVSVHFIVPAFIHVLDSRFKGRPTTLILEWPLGRLIDEDDDGDAIVTWEPEVTARIIVLCKLTFLRQPFSNFVIPGTNTLKVPGYSYIVAIRLSSYFQFRKNSYLKT